MDEPSWCFTWKRSGAENLVNKRSNKRWVTVNKPTNVNHRDRTDGQMDDHLNWMLSLAVSWCHSLIRSDGSFNPESYCESVVMQNKMDSLWTPAVHPLSPNPVWRKRDSGLWHHVLQGSFLVLVSVGSAGPKFWTTAEYRLNKSYVPLVATICNVFINSWNPKCFPPLAWWFRL